MKDVVVNTYPREGARNIGQKLIQRATSAALRAADPRAEIATILRAAPWETLCDTVSAADHERRILVPCYRTAQPPAARGQDARARDPLRRVLDARSTPQPAAEQKAADRFFVSPAAPELLGALIAKDATAGFESFQGFKGTMTEFNRRTAAAIENIYRRHD